MAPGPAALDHVALATYDMDLVAQRFSRDLGGREIARFPEASWQGLQLEFAGGIRLEVLQPIDNPRDDFLPRFLEHSGAGPHHVTFKVRDIEDKLAGLAGMGIEPVKVDLSDPNWKEAFLHPRLGLGTVVQLAQPGGVWAAERAPDPLPDDAIETEFLGAEMRADIAVGRIVFGELLEGRAKDLGGGRVAYSWDDGGTVLLHPAGGERPAVLALVFRDSGADDGLSGVAGGGADRREEALFEGPAKVVRLGSGQVWPE